MNNLVSETNLLSLRLKRLEKEFKRTFDRTQLYRFMPRKQRGQDASYWPSVDFEPRVLIPGRKFTSDKILTISQIFNEAKDQLSKSKLKNEDIEQLLTYTRGIIKGIERIEVLKQNIQKLKKRDALSDAERIKIIIDLIKKYSFSVISLDDSVFHPEEIQSTQKAQKESVLKEIKKSIDPSKPIKSKKEEERFREWYRRIEEELIIRKEELRGLLEMQNVFLENSPIPSNQMSLVNMNSLLVTLYQKELTERTIYALQEVRDLIDLKRLRTMKLDENLVFRTLMENERQINVARQKLIEIKKLKESTALEETARQTINLIRKQLEESEYGLLPA